MNKFQIKFSNPLGKRILGLNRYKIFSYYLFPILIGRTGEEADLLRSNEIFITTPNSARVASTTNINKDWLGWVNGEVSGKLPKYISWTIRGIYNIGKSENQSGGSMPSPEEYDIEVVGDEIVQTNDVGMPEWRISRKIYFKYFWLFYIVAKDYWDKYPDDIHIEPEDKDIILTEEEKKEILEQEKKVFEEALRLARENYPEFALAEEMVEEKKKEGTYWSELEAVYEESKRLKENLGKEVDETNTN